MSEAGLATALARASPGGKIIGQDKACRRLRRGGRSTRHPFTGAARARAGCNRV